MKVAILGSRGYPSTYSGYETLVRHLAPALRDLGWSVTVYCRRTDVDDHGSRADEIDGIGRVWTRGTAGKSSSTLSHGLTSCWDASRRGFDAALVLNVANGYFLPVLRRACVPTAVNVDGIEWQRDKWSRLGKAVFHTGARLVARYADAIVADSVAIGAHWQREFRRPSTFLPYGADVAVDVPSDRLTSIGVAPGAYLLVIARVVPENNIEPFLDAVALLAPSTPVVVVGAAVGPSPIEDRLRSMAASRPTFHWLGHVSDQDLLRQLRAHCGAYWHGHSVGGTNPSLLEAMACGAPVIAIDTVYNREVLGAADQLVPPEPRAIASGLRELLGNIERGTRFALSERAIVAERYQWDAVCAGYASLLGALGTATGYRAT